MTISLNAQQPGTSKTETTQVDGLIPNDDEILYYSTKLNVDHQGWWLLARVRIQPAQKCDANKASVIRIPDDFFVSSQTFLYRF